MLRWQNFVYECEKMLLRGTLHDEKREYRHEVTGNHNEYQGGFGGVKIIHIKVVETKVIREFP
jgi:hypothetical protein